MEIDRHVDIFFVMACISRVMTDSVAYKNRFMIEIDRKVKLLSWHVLGQRIPLL